MQVTAAVHHDRTLTLPRVLGLLAVILVLAIALPYGAVYTLHVRRLDAADATGRDLADRLGEALRAGTSGMPAGTQILAGPGDQPRATDERWGGTTFPLGRVLNTAQPLRPDPWGNAYLAKVAPGASGTLWVISAGPDGILQTPFSAAGDRADGDDRIARIK